MKKLFLSFCAISVFAAVPCFSSDIDHQNLEKRFRIRRMSQENIEENKKKVAKLIRNHWWLRTAAYVTIPTAAGLYLYTKFFSLPSFFGFFSKAAPVEDASTAVDDSLAGGGDTPLEEPDLVATAKDVENLKARIAVLETAVNRLKTGKKKWSWLSLAGKTVFGIAVTGIGKQIFAPAFHDDDMEWYVQQKTYLYPLIKQMKRFAQRITLHSFEKESQPDLNYYRETLAGICRRLIPEIELVAGYMKYSLESFEKRGAMLENDALLQVTQLVTITNKFIDDMHALLPAKAPDTTKQVKKLYDVAGCFASDVKLRCKVFMGIEDGLNKQLVNG